MRADIVPVHPFAMLLDPEAALEAIQRAERISRIQGRICRPLDRPLPASTGLQGGAEAGPSDFGLLDESR